MFITLSCNHCLIKKYNADETDHLKTLLLQSKLIKILFEVLKNYKKSKMLGEKLQFY